MTRLALFLGFLLALAAAVYAQHATVERSKTDKKFFDVVDIDKMDVREAIRSLFKGSEILYAIAADIQGEVTVNLKRVKFDTALRTVLHLVGGTYRIEGGVFVITRRPDVGSWPDNGYISGWQLTLTEPWTSQYSAFASLRSAGMRIQEEGGAATLLDPQGRTIAKVAFGKKPDEGPKLVAQDDDFEYVLAGTKLSKVRKSDHKEVAGCDLAGRFRFSSPYVSEVRIESDPSNKNRIQRLSLTQAEPRAALDKLFAAVGLPYDLDNDVAGHINLEMEDVTFEEALRSVLWQVDATYRDQPRYRISRRLDPDGRDHVLRFVTAVDNRGVAFEDLRAAGFRFREEGDVYLLLDPTDKVIAVMSPIYEPISPIQGSLDNEFLILKGFFEVVKVRKKDMRLGVTIRH